jgi:hypothetical protein
MEDGARTCQIIPGARIDAAVGDLLIQAMTPMEQEDMVSYLQSSISASKLDDCRYDTSYQIFEWLRRSELIALMLVNSMRS